MKGEIYIYSLAPSVFFGALIGLRNWRMICCNRGTGSSKASLLCVFAGGS